MESQEPKTLVELFSVENSWTQHKYARDINGASTRPESPEATCWCISGGIRRIYDVGNERSHLVYRRLAEATLRLGYEEPSAWNDDKKTTREQVVSLCEQLKI